ncbi:hypothetical protein ACGFZU_41765 [Streptomyces tendae]|uniref:hypothetical protein n=1 Tax=Streptomyces tendae TaxID=1932 RepID=UPI00370FF06D
MAKGWPFLWSGAGEAVPQPPLGERRDTLLTAIGIMQGFVLDGQLCDGTAQERCRATLDSHPLPWQNRSPGPEPTAQPQDLHPSEAVSAITLRSG